MYPKAVFFALILMLVSDADGCSCLPRTRRAKYCSAEFSAKVKPVWTFVFNSGTWQGRYYFVEVLDTFKPTTPLGNIMLLKTQTSSAACGVTLNLNVNYIVNGIFASGTSFGSINSCGWNELWSTAQQYPIGSWLCPNLEVANSVISRA